jgi:hypothetical protein
MRRKRKLRRVLIGTSRLPDRPRHTLSSAPATIAALKADEWRRRLAALQSAEGSGGIHAAAESR